MSKKKQEISPPAEEKQPETAEDSSSEKEDQPEKKEDALVPSDAFGNSALLKLLGENNDLFMRQYGEKIIRIDNENFDEDKIWKIIWALPDEMQDPLSDIMQRMNTERKGILSSNSQPEFLELRLFQGTGADPNRPETAIPGQFYLSSKENVGAVFSGTVLTIWEGSTMWGDREGDSAVRMPVCTSMDRKRGSRYGECASCPYRPWKDNRPNDCNNDVMAFMLSKDLKDIVLVRFQRTSEPAGRQLMKLIKRSKVPWQRWFNITSEKRTSSQDKSRRWYVMQVQVAEGDDKIVNPELHPFCDAMCTSAERDFLYSGIARIYRQAQRVMDDEDDGPAMTDEPSDSDKDLTTMDNAPDDM